VPQLDLINWCTIVLNVFFFAGVFIIGFIKFNLYSWSKLSLIYSLKSGSSRTASIVNKYFHVILLQYNFLQTKIVFLTTFWNSISAYTIRVNKDFSNKCV